MHLSKYCFQRDHKSMICCISYWSFVTTLSVFQDTEAVSALPSNRRAVSWLFRRETSCNSYSMICCISYWMLWPLAMLFEILRPSQPCPQIVEQWPGFSIGKLHATVVGGEHKSICLGYLSIGFIVFVVVIVGIVVVVVGTSRGHISRVASFAWL